MEDWQFLLQKEGDRCWLPVKMPLLEIEEGKYRILASGDRANEDLEIHLAHQAYPQDKSPRCYQKRFRRTNPAGLVVIIPLTYLTPGLWELSCGGDLLSELVGKPWQKSLKLEVLPKIGTGVPGDNQKDRQEVEEGRPTPALPGGSRQEAEVRGQRSVGSVGSVGVILSPLSSLSLDPAYLRCSSLWYSVASTFLPKQDKTRLHQSRFFDPQIIFKREVNSVLVRKPPVAKSYFADYLVIKDQLSSYPELVISHKIATVSLNLDLPEPKKMKKFMGQFQASSQQILPPKITPSTGTSTAIQQPQLPKITSYQLQRKSPSESISFKLKDNPEFIADSGVSSSNNLTVIKPKYASIDEEFQALKLQERFWSHLNSFVEEEVNKN